jgi:MraZ protein
VVQTGTFHGGEGEVGVADLVGTHRYQLDDKGRIPLPGKFRDAFARGGKLTLGYDGCVWVFPIEEYDRMAQQIRSHPVSDRGARQLARTFFGNADDVSMDKQGRMPIPTPLRQRLELGREVVVVGAGDRLEIWDGGRWNQEDEQTIPRYLDGSLSPEGRQG